MKPILARIRYKPLQVDLWPFDAEAILPYAVMVFVWLAFLAGFFCAEWSRA